MQRRLVRKLLNSFHLVSSYFHVYFRECSNRHYENRTRGIPKGVWKDLYPCRKLLRFIPQIGTGLQVRQQAIYNPRDTCSIVKFYSTAPEYEIFGMPLNRTFDGQTSCSVAYRVLWRSDGRTPNRPRCHAASRPIPPNHGHKIKMLLMIESHPTKVG